MSARNKFLTTLLSFLLLIQFIPSAQATLFPGFPQDSDIQALTIEDQIPNTFSFINNNAVDAAIGRFGTKISESPDATRFCDEFNTHGCNVNSSSSLSVMSLLPICSEKIENCVESLEFIKQDGTSVKATFDRYMKGKTFDPIPNSDMPGGSRVSLWKAEGINNIGGTNQYAVNTSLYWDYHGLGPTINSFRASVFAIKPVLDSRYRDSGIKYGPTFDQAYGTVTETGEITYDGTCVAVEAGMCAQKVEFAPDTRIKLKLKLSNLVTGWLQGRIAKPEISVDPINEKYNSLTVSADVVNVPMMYAKYSVSGMSALNTISSQSSWNGHGLYGVSFYKQYAPESSFARYAIFNLAESVKNTATEVHTYWNVSSLPNNSQNKCLSDTSKLIGFVTTNAMAYEGNPPIWNGESLEYKVAGLHYLPDGKTLTSGSYDLTMRSETARCLYNFTNAPISASISVTSQEGESKIATTVVNEKKGWLYLAAYGFSFSSPSIKVKLTQETPATAQVESSKVASKIVSIKCSKGSVLKTVKGTNPKCPTGFKKKP